MPYDNPTSLAQLRSLMADSYDGQPFWDADDVKDGLNQTLIWWNLLTGVWRRRETITLTVPNWDYALSGSLTYPLRVELDGRPLANGAIFAWDYGEPGWRTQTTLTGGDISTRVEQWAPVSLGEIAVWPAPGDASALGTLVIDGVADTPVLSAETDELELNEGWVDPLLGMALHLIAFKLRGPRWQATKIYRQQFLAAALDQNEQLTASRILRTYAGLDFGKLAKPRGGDGQGGDARTPQEVPSAG